MGSLRGRVVRACAAVAGSEPKVLSSLRLAGVSLSGTGSHSESPADRRDVSPRSRLAELLLLLAGGLIQVVVGSVPVCCDVHFTFSQQ